jgi:hypothetical protein
VNSQIGGREAGQDTAEVAEGRARARHNNDNNVGN